jgi:plastocyanin
MRRALGGAALIALVLGAILLATAGGSSNQAHAATQACAKHTKRVVRQVKRHGKRRRVVRTRHYWACTEYATPSAPAATQTPPGASTTPTPPTEVPSAEPEPEPEPEANAVAVTANDHNLPYTYAPTRTTVHAGQLTVQLNNVGMDEHDMDMQRVGPDDEPLGAVIHVSEGTKPGGQTTKTVDVEAGTYRMWCNLPGHDEKGMHAHINVVE